MRRPRSVRAVRSVPAITPRSANWASQLTRRYNRIAELQSLHMRFHLPVLAHMLVYFQQRSLTSSINLQPQVNLSFNKRSVFNSQTKSTNLPQMTLLNVLSILTEHSRVPQTDQRLPRADRLSVSDKSQRRRFVAEQENRQRLALTLAVNRTSLQLTTILNRHRLVRDEANSSELSTLLTHRVRRITESSAIQAPMALHSVTATRVSAAHRFQDTLAPANSFEKWATKQNTTMNALPPINVEMLTDQVMKQIDRRVVARKERMGQI